MELSCQRAGWFFVDFVFSNAVSAPLVVGFWRGLWEILDIYLFPKHPSASGWTSFGIGIILYLLFIFLQRYLREQLSSRSCFLFVPCSRIYTYLMGVAAINHWRGSWLLYDCYAGTSGNAVVVLVCISCGSLWILRSSRNAIASPFLQCVDTEPTDYFDISTRFKTKVINRCRLIRSVYCNFDIMSMY